MPKRALAAIVFLGCGASATPAASPPFARAPRCEGPEYAKLDFWLGDWDVASPEGAREGANAIRKVLGGCAIEEKWEDAQGGRGASLFFYDRAFRAWKQVWATSEGAWKEKTEAPAPRGVRFQGAVPRASGGRALDRTTLLPRADGAVEQIIEQSLDGGATWRSWMGVYRKRADACTGAEHALLDFWVGEWDLVVRARKSPGSDQWEEARGTNVIEKSYRGCVVEEHFHADGPGEPWAGHSVSTSSRGRWRQTWVDDQGSFLAFEGSAHDGRVIFTGEPTMKDGARVQMRMVFASITPRAFTWTWERTIDDGATWTPQMTIEYRRRK